MKKLINKIFWGVWLTYLAVIVILAFMEMLSGFPAWRIALSLLLLKIMADNIFSHQFFLLIMPVAVILCLFGNEWNMSRLVPWGFLIAGVLLSFALNIVLGRNQIGQGIDYGPMMHKSREGNDGNGYIRICANATGIIKYVNSRDLKNVDIFCSFGSLKAYFDGAHIPSGEAFIKINSKCSNVELYIPKIWNVIDRISHGNFGIDVRGVPVPDGSATVTIDGTYSFGNITIIYI